MNELQPEYLKTEIATTDEQEKTVPLGEVQPHYVFTSPDALGKPGRAWQVFRFDKPELIKRYNNTSVDSFYVSGGQVKPLRGTQFVNPDCFIVLFSPPAHPTEPKRGKERREWITIQGKDIVAWLEENKLRLKMVRESDDWGNEFARPFSNKYNVKLEAQKSRFMAAKKSQQIAAGAK